MSDFNLLNWLRTNTSSIEDMVTGNLYEHRVGCPAAQILLDYTPPKGDVIINENTISGGMRIHEFKILHDSTYITPIKYVIQDRFNNYITSVEESTIGGVLDESKYQIIGYESSNSLVLLLNHETVNKIEIGTTASKAKSYIIEIQVNDSELWLPVLSSIASQETIEFLKYTFTSDITGVTAIRIRYKGDYYASLNTGNNISISAYDKLADVVSAQISRYSDFSDSNEWIDLSEGTTIFSWDLVNNSEIWAQQSSASGIVLEPLQFIYSLGNPTTDSICSLIGVGTTKTYVMLYSSSVFGSMSVGYTFSSAITSACIHGSRIYIGLENGNFYASYDGTIFNLQSSAITQPVTALISYQNALYIGTEQTEHAIIYSWNGTSLSVVKNDLEPSTVTCFSAGKGSYLYVGTSGGTSAGLGYVYRFNGQTQWNLSFNTGYDTVQSLIYSPVNERLWCAVNNGKIYIASFDTSNLPTWNSSVFYENDSTTFYSLLSDSTKQLASSVFEPPVNNYVWICSNSAMTAYVYSAMKTRTKNGTSWTYTDVADIKFESISAPIGVGTTISAVTYFNGDLYGASLDGYIYKFNLSTVASNIKSVYVRLKDAAGNISDLPGDNSVEYIYDTITQDTDRDASGNRISDGRIYQIKYNPGEYDDKSIVSMYSSDSAGALLSPERTVEVYGSYISPPFYVANLTNWENISFLYNFPECAAGADLGIDYGVSIDLYVKTANSRTDLSTQTWGTPHSATTINVSTAAQSMVEEIFSINSLQGRWIQFYTVLTTASQNKSPELLNVSLFYRASGSSYFFTSMLDTAKQTANYRNYILNSDFEIGTTPWESDGNLLMLTTTIGNDKLGKIQRTAGVVTVSDIITSPSFMIETNYLTKTFNMSFYYKTTEDYVDHYMSVRLTNNTLGSHVDYPIDASIAGTTFTQDFTVTGSSYTVSFVLVSGTAAFDILIDNIYVGPNYGVLNIDPPKFYRGLLTANTSITSGDVKFGYTIMDDATTFDYNNSYTEIEPNRVFELETPSSKIRFGMLLTKTGDDPVVVHDFAVQMDAHDTDMKFMGLPLI